MPGTPFDRTFYLTNKTIGIRLALKNNANFKYLVAINQRRRDHMKTLLGGAIAAAFGLIGLVIWWEEFFEVLAGIVPVMLLLGGGLAIYLGFDELKDSWKKDEIVDTPASKGENVEHYQKEIDDLKEELETLKAEKEEEPEGNSEKKE